MSTESNNPLLAPIGGKTPPAENPPAPTAPTQMPTLGAPTAPPITAPRPPLSNPLPTPPSTSTAGFSPGSASSQTTLASTHYEDPDSGVLRKIFVGLGVAAVAGLAIVAFFLFRTPPPVGAPSSFTTFASGDGSFTSDAPEGWVVVPTGEAAGEKDSVRPNAVTMTSGNAQVEISMSTVSGLVGSQLLFGNEAVPEAMQGSKANGVDKYHKPAIKKRYKGYTETLQPKCPSNMGGVILDESTKDFKPDAKLYEWTATGNSWGLGGKMHGYRAVLAGNKVIASVNCQCSEGDWAKLQPAFLRVIGSVKEIGGKQPGGMNIPGAGNIRTPTGM